MKRLVILSALLLAGCNNLKTDEARERDTLEAASVVNDAEPETPAPDSPIGQQIADDEQKQADAEQAARDKEEVTEDEVEFDASESYATILTDSQTDCEYIVITRYGNESSATVVPRNIIVDGKPVQYCGQTKMRDLKTKTRKEWRELGWDKYANR